MAAESSQADVDSSEVSETDTPKVQEEADSEPVDDDAQEDVETAEYDEADTSESEPDAPTADEFDLIETDAEQASADVATDEANDVESEPPESADVTEPVELPEEAAARTEPARETATSSIASAIPLVFGGAVAALIGFAAARYMENSEPPPEGPTPAELAESLSAEQERVAALEARIATLEGIDMAAIADESVSSVEPRLAALDDTLATLSGDLDALREQVETIALRPVATGIEPEEFDTALSEFRSELNAAIETAQSEISNARSEAEQISETAFAAENAAVARAAWGQVDAAVQNGTPFAEALAEAADAVQAEIPAVLADNADDGVPSLSQLQGSFPDAARSALDAAVRASSGESTMDRLTTFLRVQTGARSLEPRDGDDPDAVLSRAEAALRAGELEGALGELDALPGPGMDAMADWVAAAQSRIDAVAAVALIADQLNSN